MAIFEITYDIGGALRKMRELRGWTARDLELRADLAKGIVYLYEGGFREPTLQTAMRLSAALGCSLEGLCGLHRRWPKWKGFPQNFRQA